MLTFYNEHHAQHDVQPAGQGDAAARTTPAQQLEPVLHALQRRGLGDIVTPHRTPLVSLERIHTPRYLHFLRTAWSEWCALGPEYAGRPALASSWPVRARRWDIEPGDFLARLGLYSSDSLSPLSAGTWNAAKTGADCAINAAHALRLGERGSFALTRPAGHHAGADYSGGACFLNNAALAAQHLLDDGLRRIAILDLDYHHGGGTQDIFYRRSDVLFVSIHADPGADYPFFCGHADETGAGDGQGYTMNLPLPRGAAGAQWLAALETACIKLGMFAPEALVVSLGAGPAWAGAHGGAGFALQGADYLRCGERLSWLGLPTVFVFEGGAALETGINTVNVLEGFETAA